PRARLRAVLLVEGQRGLVAMVPVRDQQLLIGEAFGDSLAGDAPETIATGLEVGRAARQLCRLAVVKEEDRLELRPGRPQQAQPLLLGARVRALVGKHDPALVRLQT